ncbi:hypothetical protein PVAND_000624 [Polypedilum vanderplanki]|uniref:Uncharacterized protein n=1 Tax=Polypedilum vanderplanki TaxID=319348 RepID=A0A9J6BLU5_POLVA|nr:hypothetical protein PVAND_000624 [Polypedilum vanderplanki]
MYVIFPADEVIFLSYGFAQHPRFNQPRPTLDHLREPVVPLSSGTRPSTTTTTTTSNYHNNSLKLPNNHVRSKSPPTTPTTIKAPRNRDYSPSVSFADDFMNNKSRTSVVDENTFRTGDFYNSNSNISGSKEIDNGAKKKSKLKSKISKISLGKLGAKIGSSNEQLEAPSARLKEDLDIRVSNPTFTRDNLRQKNFDAFFASGEPVYSLERKERLVVDNFNSSQAPLTPQSFATTIDTPSSFASSPLTPLTPPSYPSSPLHSYRDRVSSVGSKTSNNNNSSSNNKRPKSAESSRSQVINESFVKEPTKAKSKVFSWRGFNTSATTKMASSSGGALRDLVHPSLNEALKTQNSVSFKLVKTVSHYKLFVHLNDDV